MANRIALIWSAVAVGIGSGFIAHSDALASTRDVVQPDLCLPAWLDVAPAGSATADTFAVVRGADGFVYFGDREGLHRSEGSRLRSWYPNPSDPDALPAGRVRALERVEDQIFLGTASGLVRFDPATAVFEPVALPIEGSPRPAVFSLLSRPEGLYVGHRNGVTILDPHKGDLVAHHDTGGTGASASVFKLEPFRDGVVAVGMDRHIFISPEGASGPLQDANGSNLDAGHYAAAQSPTGDLWLSTGLGLMRIPSDPDSAISSWPNFVEDHGIQGSLRHLDFGPQGRLWIATNYDYARWDVANNALAPVQCRRAAVSASDRPLDARLFSWALGDTLVLGSTGRGPLVARGTPWAQRMVLDPRYTPGLIESAPWSATLDRGGRLIFNTNQGLFRERAPNSRRFEEVTPEIIRRAQVLGSISDEEGRLWLASLAGLFIVDGDSARKISLVRNADGQVAQGAVISLVKQGNTILAATDNGLVVIDAQSAQVQRFFSNDEGYTAVNDAPVVPLPDSRALHVSVLGDQAIVTGAQALHRIDLDAGVIVRSAVAEEDFSAGRIYSTAITPSGTVYVGTANGLVVTDLNFSEFEYRTEVEGTRLGVVSALAIAEDGSLWHNSNSGLWRLDTRSGRARSFTSDDGLHATSMNQNGINVLGDGRLLVANHTGVTLFDPASIPDEDPPQAVLASYRIDGVQRPFLGARIHVPSNLQSVAVTFGAKALRLRDDLQFEYRFGLEGDPGNGVLISASEPVDFAALTPGLYELDVRSVLAGGRASDWSSALIYVEPKWWQTTLARLGFVLLVLGLLVGILSWRASRSMRRQRLVADERSRIAQELHDTFLQEVLGALMVGRTVAMAKSMGAMQASAEQMVTLLDKAAQSARASFNALTETDKKLSLSETLRRHDPAALYGHAPDIEVIEQGTPWPLGWQRTFFISRIVKEAINNACKHGRANNVTVILKWKRLSVTVTVMDNGIGFDTEKAEKECGFGLNAMKRLGTAGRARLTIESEIGAGTRVVVRAHRYAF